MAAHTKLMIGAGFAIAGLGLIGAGAGATFTAQVSAETTIRSGGLGLSLNGESGSDVHLDVDGKSISSHFKPISKDLRLKNTGTLDMASTFLSVTATGCGGGTGSSLVKALHVKLTDVTHGKQVYDGDLCSLAASVKGRGGRDQGFLTPPTHPGVGRQLPHPHRAGEATLYRIVIQPKDVKEGLPSEAQHTKTSLKIMFSGFDY